VGLVLGLAAVAGAGTALRQQRRERSALHCAVVEALACIAERVPTAAARAVLPDLRLTAVDVLQQDARTRRYSRAAAERIEAATRDLRSLPLAGTAPRPAGELPLPGGIGPEPDRTIAHRGANRASG
jgi:hypothetical protein